MIAAKSALEIVLANKIPCGVEKIPLQKAIGRILQEDILADRPFPPYDRVAMDGIALSYAAFEKGQRRFEIEGIGAAGSPQQVLSDQETSCIEIMTGAMLPKGTDTVVRYEDLKLSNNRATIDIDMISPFQNVHQKGNDRKEGDLIIPKGKRLAAPEIGIAATVGKADLLVTKLPKTVILSTGDELVDIHEQPLPYQIRKSNVHQLQALLRTWHIEADTYHLADDKAIIERQLNRLVEEYDVLIMSGGVSKGKYDYIPNALKVVGVEKLFHRVAQRPGKPFWFGKTPSNKVVFALPGNPVSTFMCTIRYFKPWLDACLGIVPQIHYAQLYGDVVFKPDLTYYMQVQVSSQFDGTLVAVPIEGGGSGDLANMSSTNAFMELPQGKNLYQKGEVFPIFWFR